ncbi:MAG TPA: 5'-methylthioadenosine/S-adenosylhomocysteine nucleosidase [Rhodopila sp.]|jgi:adenosylhomocysteine nucleosidase|nr:5'-methylthioadenosine/S-adenosylhomocysteine nucleosidase [Rhodopila sp.]
MSTPLPRGNSAASQSYQIPEAKINKLLVVKAGTILVFMMFFALSASAGDVLDRTPRTAVISAYQPEIRLLRSALEERNKYTVNGIDFETGNLEGKPVLLFLSGVSMVNAAMATQLAFDRFAVTRAIFSGIAGGIDPNLSIGDVVVPEQWSEYLESIFAREQDGRYVLPGFADRSVANYGMMFPQPAEIARPDQDPERRFWFPIDPALLARARQISSTVRLNTCTAEGRCLQHTPKIFVGGNGASGPSFVDNAGFREYVFRTFRAAAVDMESAAVAHVAYVNRVPFIAFRSLSDLAGGGHGPNEEEIFKQLASDNSAMVVRAFLKALP